MTDDQQNPPTHLDPLAAVLAEVDHVAVSASVAAHAIDQASTATDADTIVLPTITSGLTGRTRALTPMEYRNGKDLRKQREALSKERTEEATRVAKVVEDWQARRTERPVPLADRVNWDAPIEEVEASVNAVAEEVFAHIHQATQITRAHLTLMPGGAR